MKDGFKKFDGIVTARNADTGEVIFKNLHNTIVINGCIAALSGLLRDKGGNGDTFYMIKNAETAGDPSIVSKFGSGIENLGITRYNFTYAKPPITTFDRTVPKNSETDDKSDTEEWIVAPNELMDAAYADKFLVNNFENTTYEAEDIDDNDAARSSFIFYDERTYSTFLRLRLRLSNNLDIIPYKQLNPSTDEWNAQDITYVNSVMLYLQERDNPAGDVFRFSRLKFPPIPFFGNLTVDFEYRIYI